MDIPEIQKILFSTDLSKNARYAFRYAAGLAHQYDAAITLLHVIEDLSESAISQVTAFIGKSRWQEFQKKKDVEYVELIQDRLQGFCSEMSEKLKACPFIVDDIRIFHGHPVDIILKQADTGKFDLIVMGTHGTGGFEDRLIGSTAQRVVRLSKIPVLTVRLPK